MKNKSHLLQAIVAILVVFSLLFTNIQSALAGQGRSADPGIAEKGETVRRDYHPETGKLTFLGAQPGGEIAVQEAMNPSFGPSERAASMLAAYAPEFGIRSVPDELKQKEIRQSGGREITRYQQVYQDIPVMGGELVVNASDTGSLLSMNGEISPDLALDTSPVIPAEEARANALSMVAKSNQMAPADFETTEPELWIYDSRLLEPDGMPPALVWRMDVRARDAGIPVNELVLIDAQRGDVALHFNQVDTIWSNQASPKNQYDTGRKSYELLDTWPLYFEIVLDESRGWIYGSDSSGNKIDVISATTLQLVKSINLATGAAPKGMALSPSGSELAIAQSGAGAIIFINPDTGNTVATVVPNVTIGPNKPWDVVYGRPGRLYSTGNPDASGLEFIHIIDTNLHLEINKSSHVVRSAPRLSISPDNNFLYANDANFSPQKIYKYDISTDIILGPTSTPHTSTLSAVMHIVNPANGYVFTDTGQVWSADLKAKIGSIGINGQVAFIPVKNVIVVASGSNSIAFVDGDNFYILSTYALPGPMGALVSQSDGNKIFVSTSNGIVAVNLTPFPPGTPGTLPTGSLPYSDIVVDNIHGVIYGANTTGHKIDVISMSTLQVIKEIRLVNGSSPKGMDISPDSNELAVALSGANQIAFIDTNSLTVLASVIPDSSNNPFDVKYGRPGRLYSSGSPVSGGFEYIHVIDTTTHTNVSRSNYIIGAWPSLAMSADKSYLLANNQSSPNSLHKFDISTDTILYPTSVPHASGFTANTFVLLKNEDRVFTSAGQAWSNPANLSSSTRVGSFNALGYLVEIYNLDLVAVLGNSGMVNFVDTTNYSIESSITIPSVSSFGSSSVNSDDSKLFLNTNNGIIALNLDLALPSFIMVESGSNQGAPLQSQFRDPLKAKVTNTLGQPVSGITVNFTAPSSGASGTFVVSNTNTATAVTDINGIATSPAFRSNSISGSYIVSATVVDLMESADFNLSNNFYIKTYTANSTSSIPGVFLCDQNQPNCTSGSNPHADAAHKYAIGTHNFYAAKNLRDSIDNNGMVIKSTVQYCSPNFPCPYANAFWNGAQMVYGSAYGFPLADDVVAHELTHGVTDYESNLFYYYQSGAINESLSDLWGELYDQSNGLGNDTAGVKWLLGEDVSGIGAIRSMSNPPAYGDPDSMASVLYYVGEDDNGGVHINSGVNNKAAFLMVQGGAFGGKTVTPLGADKTLAIYYEAQTNLLVSGSDYADLHQLLYQACLNLVGTNGIVMADCQEVRDATDAVKMDQQPTNNPNYNRDAPLCPAHAPKFIFSDDLESGSANWSLQTRWSYDSPYSPLAHSGQHYLYADDYPASISDASATLKEISVPYNAYLHFSHAYNFESALYDSRMYYFDGGVLEYSTNGGATWNDAGWMMDFNGYSGFIYDGWVNPLKGRPAFAGNTKGYISTRLNLTPLAGSNVKFRWRMGLDDTGSAWGWWLDDVKVYTCGPDTSFIDVANTYWAWSHIERLYTAGITGGCANNPLRYCPENTVTRGQMAVFLLKGIHGSTYTPPAVGDSTSFADVPTTYWASAWIKQLASEGITGGCGNGNYCPDNAVTRAQMAVFLLKAKYGSAYTPPPLGDGSGFADVPASNLFAPWIKQLAAEGITGGCSSGNYCPNDAVTRAQMAVFLVKAFELP